MWERHSKFIVAAELIDICLDERNFLHTADTLKMLETFGVLQSLFLSATFHKYIQGR